MIETMTQGAGVNGGLIRDHQVQSVEGVETATATATETETETDTETGIGIGREAGVETETETDMEEGTMVAGIARRA